MHDPKSYAKSIHIFILSYPQAFPIEKMRKIGEINEGRGLCAPCTPAPGVATPGPAHTILLVFLLIILSACAAEGTDKRFHGLKENVKKGRRRKQAFSPAFFSFSPDALHPAGGSMPPARGRRRREKTLSSSHRKTVCFLRLICPEVGSRDVIPGSGYRGRGAPCFVFRIICLPDKCRTLDTGFPWRRGEWDDPCPECGNPPGTAAPLHPGQRPAPHL